MAFASTGTPATSELKVPKFTVRTQEFIEFGDQINIRRFDVKRMDFFSTVNMPGAVGAGAPRTPRDWIGSWQDARSRSFNQSSRPASLRRR